MSMKLSKTILTILVLGLGLIPFSAHALFGSLPSEAPVWASGHGFKVGKVKQGSKGCLKGKRFIPLNAKGVKVYGVFFHPVYEEATAVVSQVVYEFDPPVSIAKARSYAIQLAPIVGTRPPTHKQKISASKNSCGSSVGGFEERYTQDFILEFFKASKGKGIQKLVVYNDYIR